MKQKYDETLSQYYKRIENSLLRRKPIKLVGVEKLTIGRWPCRGSNIVRRIIQLNRYYNTIYIHSSKTQCVSACRRSSGDIFLIAKHYCPEVTFEDVYTWLKGIILGKKDGISSSYCSYVNKRVYYFCSCGRTHYDDAFMLDEYEFKL